MPSAMTPQAFVQKWRAATLKERSAYQSHFLDICKLIGHSAPTDLDHEGTFFTFEAFAEKLDGSQGFADVWFKSHFAWEYKGKHANLEKAYGQLLQYREALDNPPLLIVCDIDNIEIHTNFTNTAKRVYRLPLDDLLQPERLALLRHAFYDPDKLKTEQTPQGVTEEVAAHFARLAELLRKWGEQPPKIAHFLIQLLFCLFAEDAGLLPNSTFSHLVSVAHGRSDAFAAQLRQLFAAMSTGGFFGSEEIPHFDGHLFENANVLEIDSDGLRILLQVSKMDWSSIEPSIFGTLFERSLDPSKRSQLGAHYTSKDDILLIVEPVLMAPLRRRWEQVKAEALKLIEKRSASRGASRTRLDYQIQSLLMAFAAEIAAVQVLDPACGSGNFLYVALRQLLDLEKEVSTFAAVHGVGYFQPQVNPSQLHGIEVNPYAHQLAQAVIWIGYLQWMRDNGYGFSEPILKPLDNILHMDAILAYDEAGQPIEPTWPTADVIIGNPPFLGDKKMRAELGDKYVDDLRHLFAERIPGQSDLVCYWFENARNMIDLGKVKRAGLLATQGIRGGANRKVLERIKSSGDIFWAQSDRNWVLNGATVHVSMVGFDHGKETEKFLDGNRVLDISAALQSNIDLTKAIELKENADIAYVGDTKKGKFDIDSVTANQMLVSPTNPNGHTNSDVIFPWINGLDITGRPREMWIIDFGIDTPEDVAACFEIPFEYVRKHVKPARDKVRNPIEKRLWWIHGRPAPDLRKAVRGLTKYIATPRVSKHRLFVYVPVSTIPDSAVVIFARDDDYFLGVLHSKCHELWARATGTQLRDAESGFRYSQTMTFETFPFPWPPGTELRTDPRLLSIAAAARTVVKLRDNWLNPPDISEAERQKRTLTNLYNQRPTWLVIAHRDLDAAVLAAYGWPPDLTDAEILERLLALNLERAAKQSSHATE